MSINHTIIQASNKCTQKAILQDEDYQKLINLTGAFEDQPLYNYLEITIKDIQQNTQQTDKLVYIVKYDQPEEEKVELSWWHITQLSLGGIGIIGFIIMQVFIRKNNEKQINENQM